MFKLTRGTDGIWHEQVLHAYTGGTDGSSTNTTLAFVAPGDLYGYSNYAVYELKQNSSGGWTKTDLHTFAGTPDGANPNAALTIDSKGRIFGTTSSGGQHLGIVFALSRSSQGTWNEAVLHRFASNRTEGVTTAIFRISRGYERESVRDHSVWRRWLWSGIQDFSLAGEYGKTRGSSAPNGIDPV